MDPVPELDWSAVWAASGAASLSGRDDGRPLDVPQAVVRSATKAAAEFADLSTGLGVPVHVDGPALLGERAACTGFTRRGDVSCGGGTHMLQTADGWIAVSLARDSDVESVPAWCGATRGDDVPVAVRSHSAADLVERGVLLGMPVAQLGEVVAGGAAVEAMRIGSSAPSRSLSGVVVVDLSSLWAGPLCAQLLGLAGARVIKVESTRRPDGARRGSPAFFDLLHGGHESVAFDFTDPAQRAMLRRLLNSADVVIEASRPRALEQLGIVRAEMPAPRIWLSITGHGRAVGHAERVAFGDDAAVAGGLVTEDASGICFCADAVADPLTGLAAAASVLHHLAAGDRWFLDAALSRVAATAACGPRTALDAASISAPTARQIVAAAPPMGAHTDAIVAEFGLR